MKRLDLAGKTFGYLTPVKVVGKNKQKQLLWLCQCRCGKEKVVIGTNIKKGVTVSCGCKPKRSRDDSVIGKKFGYLTILEFSHKEPKNKQYYKCICDCGNTRIVNKHYLRNHKASCGCRFSGTDRTGDKHPKWTGYQEISGTYWNSIVKTAKERNMQFNITLEYVWELFLQQNRMCALTNILLTFGERQSDDKTASLDRIDSSKGYIEGNVQWVHKWVNVMKWDLSQKEFIQICNMVAKLHPINI